MSGHISLLEEIERKDERIKELETLVSSQKLQYEGRLSDLVHHPNPTSTCATTALQAHMYEKQLASANKRIGDMIEGHMIMVKNAEDWSTENDRLRSRLRKAEAVVDLMTELHWQKNHEAHTKASAYRQEFKREE